MFFTVDDRSFEDASAFFQVALNDGDRGDRRHSFSACLAAKTATWQDSFHQGRQGSFGGLQGWVDKLKVELLEAKMAHIGILVPTFFSVLVVPAIS